MRASASAACSRASYAPLTATASAGGGKTFLRAITVVAAATRRRQWPTLAFGVLVGLLLGVCLNFDTYSDVEDAFHVSFQTGRQASNSGAASAHTVRLRCVILVQPKTKKLHKYLSAALDTYAGKCDSTLIFTNSATLVRQFAEFAEIFLIETSLSPSQWPFVAEVIRFVAAIDNADEAAPAGANASAVGSSVKVDAPIWTVILNEQNFLFHDHLRAFLSQRAAANDAPVIVGRLIDVRSIFSYIFPFAQWQTRHLSLEAGVVLSRAALHAMAGGEGSGAQTTTACFCGASAWTIMPRYAGKALLKCALRNNFAIWDPVDEDGHHLFVPMNLRLFFAAPDVSLLRLFATRHAAPNDASSSSDASGSARAECCSDRAIAFAHLTPTDIRVLHFATRHLHVFGA